MNEPVAYINVEERNLSWAKPIRWKTPTVVNMDKIPLYTKKEWVGLTDDEINAAWDSNLSFARAIEAKLKEKNA